MQVSGFLRLVGIINAAIWFGAALFFAAGILPAVFSSDMHSVFNETGDNTYYSGSVAILLFRRFFVLQIICGLVAMLHLLAEKFYQGRAFPRIGGGLVLVMLALYLLGGLWLQPKMENLRHIRYFGQTQEQKDHARHSFGIWHGISLGINFLILGGLLGHLVRVSQPVGPARYGNFYQIP
jgi:hypothetical protein